MRCSLFHYSFFSLQKTFTRFRAALTCVLDPSWTIGSTQVVRNSSRVSLITQTDMDPSIHSLLLSNRISQYKMAKDHLVPAVSDLLRNMLRYIVLFFFFHMNILNYIMLPGTLRNNQNIVKLVFLRSYLHSFRL